MRWRRRRAEGLRARDVMTTNVRCVSPEMSFADLERFFANERVGGAPVVEQGRVVGLISRTDIVRCLGQEQAVVELSLSFYRSHWEEEGASMVELLSQQSQAAADRVQSLCVRDAMTRPVLAVLPDDSVQDVARKMAEHRVHRILVHEGDELRGLISSLDLVSVVAEHGLAVA